MCVGRSMRHEGRGEELRVTEAQFSKVLAWIRDVTLDSPSIAPIVGVSPSELRQLARLATLLTQRLGDQLPSSLMAALTPDGHVDPSPSVLSAFDRILEEDAVVRLASLYAAIVRSDHRRPLGTFFTPRDSAQAIIDAYEIRHGAPVEVVDVGAGVGIFSEIAQMKWPTASVYAVDINPLTLGLQAVVAARRPGWKINLELADYREWLSSHAPRQARLYLGNPPYTRWQLLHTDDRTALLESTGGLVGARANLSTLFLAMTLYKLRDSDSLAMIIPAGWMRAEYGRKLRLHLRAAEFRRVTLRLADSWRFENAIVDAVLVEVGPRSATRQPIEVSDWSGSEQVTVNRGEDEAPFPAPGREHLVALADIGTKRALRDHARVTRGTASGAYKFFIQSATAWNRLGIPEEYRIALARRLRPGSGGIPALETAELLVLTGYRMGIDPHVDAWIALGKASGVDQGHLCSQRSDWFDLSSEVKVPDVILSALAKDSFHVMPNTDGLSIANNLFGLYWKADTDQATQEQIINWLRSAAGQRALRSSASVEANGLRRLSPKALGILEIPIADGRGIAYPDLTELATTGGSRT
jgi:methylase of polypeptide subunit release factors